MSYEQWANRRCVVCRKKTGGPLACKMGECSTIMRKRSKMFNLYSKRSSTRYPFYGREWFSIVAKFDSRCAYCKEKFDLLDLTVDHVVPLSRGGTHSVGNVVPACEDCNRDKDDMTITEWKFTKDTPIYAKTMKHHRRHIMKG